MKQPTRHTCLVAGAILVSVLLAWSQDKSQKSGPIKADEPAKSYKNSLGMEFVLIPAGKFQMGSSDIEAQTAYEECKRDNRNSCKQKWFTFGTPQHQVLIGRLFYLGKYEVTQEQWEAVMSNNPSYHKGNSHLPVEMVSWNDTQGFLAKLNTRNDGFSYRLPTEAEWEYACRARTTTPFAFGETITKDLVNFYGGYLPNTSASKVMYFLGTTPVGSFHPNAWGLYDMHGNVEECCQDWQGDDYYSQSQGTDPQGPGSSQFRVLRGGSWATNVWNCRSASRSSHTPDCGYPDSGFRVVAVPAKAN